MDNVKLVEPEEILPRGSPRVTLTPLQAVGVHGAVMVGALGAVLLLALLAHWFWLEPRAPTIPIEMQEKDAAVLLARYKDIQAAVLDSTLKMIDGVVVRIVLPVFTSFVGYIFGSQAGSRSS